MKTKLHIVIIVTLSLAWLILSAGGDVALSAWQPPIGIPEPPFGITTTHMMYADPTYTYDYGSGPEPYRIGSNGPYTHYIDISHPDSTNVDNPYGTPSKPRKGIPSPLSAGSVVEIHGGTYGSQPLVCNGTAALPIFIRGVEGSEPVRNHTLYLTANYTVLENMEWDLDRQSQRSIYVGYYSGGQDHIAIRNCEFHNMIEVPTQSRPTMIFTIDEENTTDLIENVVIYKNKFHNCGEGRTGGNWDINAVALEKNVQNVWILENEFYYLGGDGVHVFYDHWDSNSSPPNHIYIGRNIFHDNFENAVDLKVCEDVVVSQNIAYNFGEGYSSICGAGTGTASAFRYGLGEGPTDVPRQRIWTIFNIAYNCNSDSGAFANFVGSSDVHADEIYFIGNVVYNCHNTAGTATAFGSLDQENIYWVHNTAYDCDRGGVFYGDRFGTYPNERLVVINNIFGDINSTSSHNLVLGGVQASLDRMTINNNIFYNSSGDVRFRVGVYNLPDQDWSTYLTFADFNTAYPVFLTASVEDNPDHIDAANGDFRLQGNSPARDAGADVQVYFDRFYDLYGIDISVDFDGNPIPQGSAPDIGAYEYVLFPVSIIQNEPKEGHAPLTVSFDGSQSTSPHGDIVSYGWDFGDGSTSTGMKTSHIFTSAGEYTVTLTVTDDLGLKGESQIRITVFEKEFGELPASCYNNVFNPIKGEKALIVVEVPKQAYVRLNLYNTRGNKIIELANEQKEAGTHKYYWDGKSGNGNVVGSGLYFVHIQAGDYKKTKKIVVVK